MPKITSADRGQELAREDAAIKVVIKTLNRLTRLNWGRCSNVRSAVRGKLRQGKTISQVVSDMVDELVP